MLRRRRSPIFFVGSRIVSAEGSTYVAFVGEMGRVAVFTAGLSILGVLVTWVLSAATHDPLRSGTDSCEGTDRTPRSRIIARTTRARGWNDRHVALRHSSF